MPRTPLITTRLTPLFTALVVALLGQGCSDSSTPGGSVGTCENAACEPGFICVEEACTKLCTADHECPNGQICNGDFCIAGTRNDAPIITSIDGDSTMPGGGGTPHRTSGKLIINGGFFTGASVSLTNGANNETLFVCDATDERLVVELPSDLQGGAAYTLTVASQGGSCNATLPTLRGEPGDDGLDGLDGATGPVGPTGPAPSEGDIQNAVNAMTDLDVPTLAGRPAAEYHDTLQWGRFFEAENAPLSSDVTTGTVTADTTASGGSARRMLFGSAAGKAFGVSAADLDDGKLALGPSTVEYRLKVLTNASASRIATLRCTASRSTGGSYQDNLDVFPNRFPAADAWLPMSLACDFRPDDTAQSVALVDYVSGITELSLDHVRLSPADWSGQDNVVRIGNTQICYGQVSTTPGASTDNVDVNTNLPPGCVFRDTSYIATGSMVTNYGNAFGNVQWVIPVSTTSVQVRFHNTRDSANTALLSTASYVAIGRWR